jgi:hypothetical protein
VDVCIIDRRKLKTRYIIDIIMMTANIETTTDRNVGKGLIEAAKGLNGEK